MSAPIPPTPSCHRRRRFLAFALFALVGSVTTAAHTGTQLTFRLTPAQKAKVVADTKNKKGNVVVKVALSETQFQAIKKRFPGIRVRAMSASIAAPFIPGGAVVSAAISGLSQTKGALGSLSTSSDG